MGKVAALLVMICLTHSVAVGQKLRNAKDTLSYAVGQDMARALESIGVELNSDLVLKALHTALTNDRKLILPREDLNNIIQRNVQIVQHQQAQAKKIASKQEFDKLVSKRGIVRDGTGIAYEILEEGDGIKAGTPISAKVNYIGKLTDGTEFDNSYRRGEPFTFSPDRVIRGWQLAIPLMSRGARYRVYIPQELAYGDRATGPIPVYSNLIFEIELIDFERNTESDEFI